MQAILPVQRQPDMKTKTLLHYFDPPVLAALSGLCLGLSLLLHPLFLLLSFVFALIWVGEARGRIGGGINLAPSTHLRPGS